MIVKGIYDMGISTIMDVSFTGGRWNMFDFDPNPLIRQSFWSLFFGYFFHFSMQYGIDQEMLQRFQSAKTRRSAQIAILLNIPGVLLLFLICCFTGIILYASYENCDPLSDPSKITNTNQLLPYYVADRLRVLNGAIGLFFAAILSGGLSSISSCFNSLATILWIDLLKNFSFFNSLSDSRSTFVTKILVVLCGALATSLALYFTTTTGNIIQISGALNGAIAAPLVGLFALSAIFESSNLLGACVGTISGLLIGLWLSIGQTLMKPEYVKLKVGIDCYLNETIGSMLLNKTNLKYNTKTALNLSSFNKIYSISYMHLAIIPVIVTILVGLLVSLSTGGLKQRVEKKLLLFRKLDDTIDDIELNNSVKF